LAKAFEEGSVAFSVVRELTRVAAAETEAAWLEAAHGRTAREVERLVSGRTKGDSPMDPRRLEAERRRMTLNLSAEAYALLREARRALTQRCGHGLDDDALVAMLSEAVLSGGKERDTGRSAYQVALTLCESCRHATQVAGGRGRRDGRHGRVRWAASGSCRCACAGAGYAVHPASRSSSRAQAAS
jgi:hypothetical protein